MKKQAAQPGVHLEEIRPHCFFVRDMRAYWLLKSEGTMRGTVFELTSWRRAGLLARLEANGFVVNTLDDQIATLPALPPAEPIGETCRRLIKRTERLSYFDPYALAWVPLEADQQVTSPTLMLYAGWVVRQRQGRGPVSFARVICEADTRASLVALTETQALLHGYAQAQHVTRPPIAVTHDTTTEYYHIPLLPLPPPHHYLLRRLCHAARNGWQADHISWPLVCNVYQRLGLSLSEQRE